MKLTDYIANFLAERGVTHAFGMSGGAAVHMFDSIDRHPRMHIISMTHEQCAAMAADGYARASGRLGVAVTTSGPGATNLLTGTCCSYYDSVPTLMLTGQVATHRLKGDRKVRQVGFQETDVVAIFSPVTKYAVQLSTAEDIRYQLEKAYHIAFEGRPGPVLIDVPDDLQRAEIEPTELRGFIPLPCVDSLAVLAGQIGELLKKIRAAERPVLVLGGGLKTPVVWSILQECVDRLGIPVLLSWAAIDLLESDHPLRVGPFGVYGPRAGNFTVQNADLVIALGTRLSQNLTGGILCSFARTATIAMVDTDEHEMSKFDGCGIEIKVRIKARLGEFLAALKPQLATWEAPGWSGWKAQIQHWQQAFPPDASPCASAGQACVDAYDFVRKLSGVLPENALLFVDTGGNLTWTCNGLVPKRGQRIHSAWNNTPMGYALPAAIGAALFDPRPSLTCITGDGGLMLCLAELATVAKHRLPVKILLFNNHSHGIQKQTLETWLNGRYVGVDPASGLAFPTHFSRVAEALGLLTYTIDGQKPIAAVLAEVYAQPGPVFVNVEINPDQKLYPVLKFGSALENQSPLLSATRVQDEMIVKPFSQADRAPVATQQATPGW
ncbi:MAG: acetolactate synthase [Opitutia bacterium Tous-C4FEB]|nr:MAG: acetolactate synthase [Opitutae bacterium Tous-C4FEB]